MRTPPKAISLTDPAAALSAKHGPAAFAYGMNAMVDTGSGVILEVQAAPERFADEPIAVQRMVERLRDRHGATPGVLTADKAYGAGPFLAWLEDREIEAHVPLIDRRHQTGGVLTQDAFVYDEATDTCTCPQSAILRRYGTNDASQRYRASRAATAGPAPSRRAARTARCAPCAARPMRRSASGSGPAKERRPSAVRCGCGRPSSTCSATSNTTTGCGVSDCGASEAPTSSSCSRRRRETSDAWPGGPASRQAGSRCRRRPPPRRVPAIAGARRRGSERTNPPAADGDGVPHRAVPAPFSTVLTLRTGVRHPVRKVA